jgi:hypothetical protein
MFFWECCNLPYPPWWHAKFYEIPAIQTSNWESFGLLLLGRHARAALEAPLTLEKEARWSPYSGRCRRRHRRWRPRLADEDGRRCRRAPTVSLRAGGYVSRAAQVDFVRRRAELEVLAGRWRGDAEERRSRRWVQRRRASGGASRAWGWRRRGSKPWRRRRGVQPESSGAAAGCLRWWRCASDLPMASALERRCRGPIWVP